jgi:hypothetical protein
MFTTATQTPYPQTRSHVQLTRDQLVAVNRWAPLSDLVESPSTPTPYSYADAAKNRPRGGSAATKVPEQAEEKTVYPDDIEIYGANGVTFAQAPRLRKLHSKLYDMTPPYIKKNSRTAKRLNMKHGYIKPTAPKVDNTTAEVVHIDGFRANLVGGKVEYVPLSRDMNKDVVVSDNITISLPSTFHARVIFENARFLQDVIFKRDVLSTGSLEFHKRVTFWGNADLGQGCQFHDGTMFYNTTRLGEQCCFHARAQVVFIGEVCVGRDCRFDSSVQFADVPIIRSGCVFMDKTTFEVRCHIESDDHQKHVCFNDEVCLEDNATEFTFRNVSFNHRITFLDVGSAERRRMLSDLITNNMEACFYRGRYTDDDSDW